MAPKRFALRRQFSLIAEVSERFEIHPQTLRLYEREGLLHPARSSGNTRLYDDQALQRLETILFLTRELGVNLAGVEVILNLTDQLADFDFELDDLLQLVKRLVEDRKKGRQWRHALVRVEKLGRRR
jgi:MerR family transcriptional regulator/heat shock protein HspR